MTKDTDQISDLIRRASARETDDAALSRAVLSRIARAEQRRLSLPALGPGLAAAGFAASMMLAGVGGYAYPNFADTDDEILLLAMGELSLIDEEAGQ